MMKNIFNNRLMKYSLGLIGAVVLGAFGSGLWEVLLKPFFSLIGQIIFSNTSDFIQYFKDSMFESAAKGLHEESSISAYLLVLGIMSSIISVAIFFAFGFNKSRSKELDEVDKKLDEVKKEKIPDPSKLDEIEKLLDKHSSKLRIKKIFLSFYLVAFITFLFIQFIFIAYKNEVITDFKQNLIIIKPFIDFKEIEKYESRFAMMKSENEYKIIMEEIKKVAFTKNIDLPN